MEEFSKSIEGKQIIWNTATNRSHSHMRSEPLRRRDQLKEAPRLKQIQNHLLERPTPMDHYEIVDKTKNDLLNLVPNVNVHSIERREKKQVGIVKPLLTMKTDENQWNCSELEKLQKRFSELLDGKFPDEDSTINKNALIERLQSLYSSMGSHIFVSPCLVRLYHLTDLEVCSLEQWKCLGRGYPIWLYNTGFNPRRSLELRFILVDEKTGFILWSDRITSISNVIQPTHLTLSFRHSSNQSSIMLRFGVLDEKLFTQFYSYLKQNQFFTENSLQKKFSRRLIRKSDISPPCHFKHFNHLDENLTNGPV